MHSGTVVGPHLLLTVYHDIKKNSTSSYYIQRAGQFRKLTILLALDSMDVVFASWTDPPGSAAAAATPFLRLSGTRPSIRDPIGFSDHAVENSFLDQEGTVVGEVDAPLNFQMLGGGYGSRAGIWSYFVFTAVYLYCCVP